MLRSLWIGAWTWSSIFSVVRESFDSAAKILKLSVLLAEVWHCDSKGIILPRPRPFFHSSIGSLNFL
jgi:hypothetical protein